MRIAIATFSGMPPEFRDDERLAEALSTLGATPVIESWDDPGLDWDRYDTVVIRSTWNFARRRDDFLAWAERIGDRRNRRPVENCAEYEMRRTFVLCPYSGMK